MSTDRFAEFRDRTGWLVHQRWVDTQEKFRLVAGPEGVRLRAEHYAPFFQHLGRDVKIDYGCYFRSPWRIVLQDGVGINREAIFEGSSAILIGRNTRIGHRFFIHSANHRIEPDEYAFFERGYNFAPVVVGENSLISANVSLLPGARLGAGSFVAANTVVIGKQFPPGAYLAGNPASPMRNREHRVEPRLQACPSIACVVPNRDFRTLDGVRLLTTVLGCPQLCILQDGEAIPDACRVAILFGGAFVPRRPGLRILQLVDGDDAAAPPVRIALPNGTTSTVPTNVRYEVVYNGFGVSDDFGQRVRAIYFHSTNAALKSPPEQREQNRVKWAPVLAVALSSTFSDSRWRPVFDRLGAKLIHPEINGSNWHDARPFLEKITAKEIDAPGREAIKRFFTKFDRADFDQMRPLFVVEAHVLPLWAYRWRGAGVDLAKAFLDYLQRYMKTSARKSAIGCAYIVLGQTDEARAIATELLDDAWRVPNGDHVRTLLDKTAIERSPSLNALLVWRFFDSAIGNLTDSIEVPLKDWRLFAPADDGGVIPIEALFDSERNQIARALFENWLSLQQLPEIAEGHLYLANAHYNGPCDAIEQVWRTILARILSAAGLPMLQLLPWPKGYEYAVSLRYDVDRATSSAQVRNILRLQKERFNNSCGSWYFFINAAHNASIREYLHGWNQEDGRHTNVAEDAEKGAGVTAHSGPMSEYWRGQSYVTRAQAAGASYAEAMVTRFKLPRPGWLGASCSTIWLTPLHFPLEGTTREATTQYFDQLLPHFRDQIAHSGNIGGLAIIGSHPDCNQDILDQITVRENLEEAWAVPVETAVARVKSIFNYGAIEIRGNPADPSGLYLCARETIADLVVEITNPGSIEPIRQTVQLNPGIPRKIYPLEQRAIV